MPVRLSIAKLSTSGIAPLQTPPRFQNELLQPNAAWPKQINYLRGVYGEIFLLWKTDSTDEQLFAETEPKFRELIVGLDEVAKDVPNRPDMFRMLQNARRDFEAAVQYAAEKNYKHATTYVSYSLLKISGILDGLTALANKKGGKHVTAYGYDITGEVMEPGERESRSPNLWDQGNSPKFDRTAPNPANQLVDADAENDYPTLKEFKHKRIQWPARTR